uniref:Uncharacterized protein n=1 Tax=Panagrolaimus davidi TaxID=227884 RepID=A0A914PL28_9BILA
MMVAEINGKPSYYPIECLTVAPGQKAKISNLAPENLKLYKECTNIKNFQRFEEIENVPSVFKLLKDPFCRKLQLSMEESPIHVKAKIFSPPKLEYKNKKVSPDSLGKWKISSIVTKYFDPSSCEKWKAVLLDSPKIGFNTFTKFLDYYHKTATLHGLELKLESFGEQFIFPATKIPANVDKIYEMFQNAKANSVEFILFGCDETDEDIYCKFVDSFNGTG